MKKDYVKLLGKAEAHLWLLLQDPEGYRETAKQFLCEQDSNWFIDEDDNEDDNRGSVKHD